MPKEKFITALDIGSSSIRCIVAEKGPQSLYNILASACVTHNCIKRGVAIKLKELSAAISNAVYAAEEESGKKLHSVYVNVCDPNITGMLSRGEIVIADRDSEITHYDIEKVIKSAKSINLAYEREIFHTVNLGYTVDGEAGIFDPNGMFGFKLEADVYLITVKASVIENLKKAIRQAGIGIADLVISSIPTALALLSDHERKIGTVLVDIGADITEVSIYVDNLLQYIKILPIGGNQITEKIARRFNLAKEDAERVKLENADLDKEISDHDEIILNSDLNKKKILKKDLQVLMRQAYKDLFISIKIAAFESRIFRDAANGVVLSGAVSIADGAAEMAELEFGAPVRVGHITGLGLCVHPIAGHIYDTCVGLIKYGFIQNEQKRGLLQRGAKNAVTSIFSYARTLYREYF